MNNEKLVEESIELVEKMRLFSSKKINIEGIEEVNDFQLAQELAYDYDEYIIDGEECYTWDDIKELEMSKVKEVVYEKDNYKQINEELRSISISNISEIIISDECKEVWDDVYGDLINCIRIRAIVGKKNHLYEKIFEVYLSGGWPCGWSGNYQNGALKVYYPKSS